MRRWETFTALAAVVLASVGSFPHLKGRLFFTAAAVVLIAIVGLSRLMDALKGRQKKPPAFDPGERAKLIRAQREKSKRS